MMRKRILGPHILKLNALMKLTMMTIWRCYDQFMDITATNGSYGDEPFF